MDAHGRYSHDCDDCIGLGPLVRGSNRFDLYLCPRCDEGTVIARFSDEPSAYLSMPLDILAGALERSSHRSDDLIVLGEARDRVQRFGLLGETITGRRAGRYAAK